MNERDRLAARFLDVYVDACRATSRLVDESLMRARYWSDHKGVALNERQRKVINKMLEAGPGRFEGGLTLRRYVGIVDTSRSTAFRDIEDLVKNGLLLAEGTGRGTRYNLALPGWEWKPFDRDVPVR